MLLLVLLLLLLPFLEIYVLISVGGAIGVLPTIILVLGLSMFGAYLLRWQGLATLFKVQDSLAQGEMPVAAMIDGAGLTVAAALLIAPGLITDAVGFLLLVPEIRRWAMRRLLGRLTSGHAFEAPKAANRKPSRDAAHPGGIIEGEFKRLDE